MALREQLQMWPVALVVAAALAVRIGFVLADPPDEVAPRAPGYPVRIELGEPPAETQQAPIRFAAETPGGVGSAIAIRKAVTINRVEAGSTTVRVSAESELAISAGELRRLLARAGRADLARIVDADDGRFVGFEDLRGQGIDVRYDAAADRIAIVG